MMNSIRCWMVDRIAGSKINMYIERVIPEKTLAEPLAIQIIDWISRSKNRGNLVFIDGPDRPRPLNNIAHLTIPQLNLAGFRM